MSEDGSIRPAFERWRAEQLSEAGSAGRGLDPLEIPDETRSYLGQIGFPGAPPFTRGVYPGMYLHRQWTMRQYAGFGTAAQTNARFRDLLEAGQTGLSTAFDLPTQMGYDSDHRLAEGEVGRVGVAIDSLADMDRLFQGISLDRITTSMTINATAPMLLGMYIGVGRERRLRPEQLAGTLQNDILKEYVARGTYIYPVDRSMELAVDLMAYCMREARRWNPISVSGYHMREAGATAAQELGYTLAHGVAYAEAALEAGLSLPDLLPRFSFFFGVHNNFLEEVAKFRAARRLWSRLVSERLGVDAPECRRLRFHAQTCGSTLTAQDPMNNAVRSAYQALAAVLGGTQSLHVNAFDEAIGLPSDAGARLAVRTQQILAHESGITCTVDPLGGSYAVEKLTDRLEEEAVAVIESVDAGGGAAQAAADGTTAGRIADSAYAAQKRMESGEDIVVGVNRFQASPKAYEAFRWDASPAGEQLHALAEHRRLRDAGAVAGSLDAVRQAAQAKARVTDAVVTACQAGATVGEMSDALRDVYGVYGGGR